jgi:hypothetical protein
MMVVAGTVWSQFLFSMSPQVGKAEEEHNLWSLPGDYACSPG